MENIYKFSNQELAWLQAVSALIGLLALLISLVAIYIAVRAFLLKKGSFIRGNYNLTNSSITTENKFVNEVMLENLKDRSIVIFAIYLQLSSRYMIEIENFDDSPFILKPFEILKRKYDPVDFYEFNTERYNLNEIFDSNYKSNRLILSTSEGKVVVKKSIPSWNPVYDWFKNHLYVTVHTVRAKFDGRSYGSNILYLVEIFEHDEKIQTIPIYPSEFHYKWFKDLNGNEKTLKSANNIKKIFNKAIKNGIFKADKINVIDAKSLIEEAFPNNDKPPVVAKEQSWFYVHIFGRFATWFHSRKLRIKNKETMKTSKLRKKEMSKNEDKNENAY